MSGPTILVADDDASVRLVISQTLAQDGYHVRSTNTMSALWRWIQAGEGDLLITDVYMPDESIFDMLPQIRRARPDLPVIVISAQSPVITAAHASEQRNRCADLSPMNAARRRPQACRSSAVRNRCSRGIASSAA
jgi:two-component system nitrogen regulation response regulator GlnG